MPFSKRAMDVVFSAAALIAFLPLMLAAALAVKLSSRGPVFYVAPRAGRFGKHFGQLKFRTMHVGSDRKGAFTTRNDSRIFAAGKVLRLLKIDEMPQLLNVLRGEMSIVGPRPEEVRTVEKCYTPEQRRVLDAVPGLTGLVQVRYFPELSIIDPGGMDPQRHYKEVILPMRLEVDFEYIRERGFWYDFNLILWTAWLIVSHSTRLLIAREAQPTPAAQ